MFIIQAPYPLFAVTTVLPDPEYGDGCTPSIDVTTQYTVTGQRYSYVKKRQVRRKLEWRFVLQRDKGCELAEFLRRYSSAKVRVIDHNAKSWVGYFVNDGAFDLTTAARAANGTILAGEKQTITLKFEGTAQ